MVDVTAKKKRRAVIGGAILFVFAALFIFTGIFVPKIGSTEKVTDDNIFMHEVTATHTQKENNLLYIYIEEDDRPLIVDTKNRLLKDKADMVYSIVGGDKIVFWTFPMDSIAQPNATAISVCALTVNGTPIISVEEFSRHISIGINAMRASALSAAAVAAFFGVFLLVRAFGKKKDADNGNGEKDGAIAQGEAK